MALKVKKTEHAGAKNGGGHWGSRSEAKSGAKQRRRQESKRIISNAVKTESEAVTKSARAEINRRLKQVEIDHGVKIVYAVESGSRVWGFHSPDSDFDVRFLYIRPMAWYLSVRDRRDVIEVPIEDDFDLSGWDLQKALNLMSKSNPPLFEWFSSPIVYRTSLIAEQLRKLGKSYFNPRAAIYHYLHMADGNYRTYLQGDNVRLKKYLYVLRPLFCCQWIAKHHRMPPLDIRELVEAQTDIPKNEIERLLAAKSAGAELSEGPRIEALNKFIERQLDHFAKTVRVSANAKLTMDDLDEFFFYSIKNFDKFSASSKKVK